MGRSRELAIGLTMLIGGLVVVGVGAILPSKDAIVALGWLLFLPALVSVCGAVFVAVSLARNFEGASPSATVRRIVGLAAVAGLGFALDLGAASILSQLPDSLAGLNAPFVPGSTVALSAFVIGGMGLPLGLVVGAVAALLWWSLRGRRQRFRIPQG